jgi:hypothetical protein
VTCSALESVDALIARAKSVRAMSPLSRERNAELLSQHGELLTALETLRAYIDGQATITSALSARVSDLASLYSETAPGQWTIRPQMATRFKGALYRLLDLVRDLRRKADEQQREKP